MSQTIGYSLVGVEASLRTVTVDPGGGGDHTTIQAALDASLPGDTILVVAGTYMESFNVTTAGTEANPIVIRAADTLNPPVIMPRAVATKSYVAIGAEWIILQDLVVTDGQHGIVVGADHVLIETCCINDNYDTGDDYGQGVMIVSCSNVAVYGCTIYSNGLQAPNPWLIHGVYISNYYGLTTENNSVVSCNISNHAGSGVQVFHATNTVTNTYIGSNQFTNNTIEIILVNSINTLVTGNLLEHDSYPPETDAPEQDLLWLELNTSLDIRNNEFTYVNNGSLPTSILRLVGQTLSEVIWSGNTWNLPSPEYDVISDSWLNAAGGAGLMLRAGSMGWV